MNGKTRWVTGIMAGEHDRPRDGLGRYLPTSEPAAAPPPDEGSAAGHGQWLMDLVAAKRSSRTGAG